MKETQVKLLQFISAFGGLDVAFVAIDPSNKNDGVFNSGHQAITVYLPRKESFEPWILSENNIHNAPELSDSEIFTLAHELGHAISMRKGYHTQELLRSKIFSQIGLGVDGNVIREEERAWEFAEWVLRSIDYGDLGEFHKEKEIALDTYRYAGK